MRKLKASIFALLMMAGAANAVPITGTTSFTSTGTAGVVAVVNLLSAFSFDLEIGESVVVKALALAPNPGNGTRAYAFSIADSFAFSSPGIGTAVDAGTGTFHVKGKSIDSGGFIWAFGAAGANIALIDGYLININLSNISFVGDAAAGGDRETVAATFTLVGGPVPAAPQAPRPPLADGPIVAPAAVPEPAALTLFGIGLVWLGAARKTARSGVAPFTWM